METSQGIQDLSCRICRESACRKRDTFDLDSVSSSLFEFCMGIQITKYGPLSFCESCSNKLRDYGDFKSLCLQSEEIWKSLTNYFPVQDRSVNNSNIVHEGNVEENDGYPDTFDHGDCDYNVIMVFKEENDENLVKKLEDKLTEISIKKIEKPLVKFEVPTETPLVKFEELTETPLVKFVELTETPLVKFVKLTEKPLVKFEELTEKPLVKFEEPTDQPRSERKTRNKIVKIIKRCKGEKRDKELEAKSNKKPKPSKNNSNVSVKQEVTDLYCGFCDFTSSSSVKMKKHLIQHCQENVLNCQLCTFEGKDVAHMIAHRYTHCPQKTKKLECPLCSKVFFAARKLQFHYRTVHLGTKGGLCVTCGRIFGSYKHWLGHEKGHFTKNYICDHCGMSFYYRYHIEEHMYTHYDVFNFICDLCGRAFKKSSNLKNHRYYVHTVHEKVKCPVCEHQYASEKNLKKHMLLQHSERKYICEVCAKGFCVKSKLKAHMFYHHSDEKPFECNVCGGKFRSKDHLLVHFRSHTGELPFRCEKCGKGFRSSSALNKHHSVHTGVRSVKCLHCAMSFHERKQMWNHCKSKHNILLNSGEQFDFYKLKTEADTCEDA